MFEYLVDTNTVGVISLTCNCVCVVFYLLCLIYTFCRKNVSLTYNICYSLTLIVLAFGVCYNAAEHLFLESTILLTNFEYVLRSLGSTLLLFYTFLYIRGSSDNYNHILNLKYFTLLYGIMQVPYFIIETLNTGERNIEIAVTVFVYLQLYCVVIAHLLLYFKKLNRTEAVSLIVGILLITGTVILNQINNEFAKSGVYLLSCITILIYYISLQNPTNYRDSVTHLLNYDSFMQYVTEKMDTDVPFYVLSLNIKHFKGLNNLYGADVCNQYLVNVAKILTSMTKHGEIFRLYGAHFAIVHPKEIKVQRIKTMLEHVFDEAIDINNFSIKTEVKLGIACYPRDAKDPQTLYGILEFTANSSKNALTSDITSKLSRHVLVENALRRCIANQEITVVYQPIYDTGKRIFNSAEALARIDDPILGRISPGEFIPIAESNGLIVQLGLQIIKKVCDFIRDNNISQYQIDYIEVNVSPLQCAQADFAESVIEIVKESGIPVNMLNIEITETATNNSADVMKENLDNLSSAGFVFSLDDYGTCSSNIENMLTFPFKYIKIDRCLIQAYANKESQILPFLIVMLKNDGYLIIAEGAEDASQARMLMQLGVDYVQGFCYSKPLDVEDYLKFIKKFNMESIFDTDNSHEGFDVSEALRLINNILNQKDVENETSENV